jgi:hypothetical protein
MCAELGMRKISDPVLAARLIKVRDQGGYRLGYFLRMNAWRYAFLLVYFIAALAFFALTGMWIGFSLVLGMVIGFFARDMGWLRAAQQMWAFNLKIIDWGIVEVLAGQSPPG